MRGIWKFISAFFSIAVAGSFLVIIASFLERLANEWGVIPEINMLVPLSGAIFDGFIELLNARSTPFIIIAALFAWIEVRNNFTRGILRMMERIRVLSLPFGRAELGDERADRTDARESR